MCWAWASLLVGLWSKPCGLSAERSRKGWWRLVVSLIFPVSYILYCDCWVDFFSLQWPDDVGWTSWADTRGPCSTQEGQWRWDPQLLRCPSPTHPAPNVQLFAAAWKEIKRSNDQTFLVFSTLLHSIFTSPCLKSNWKRKRKHSTGLLQRLAELVVCYALVMLSFSDVVPACLISMGF